MDEQRPTSQSPTTQRNRGMVGADRTHLVLLPGGVDSDLADDQRAHGSALPDRGGDWANGAGRGSGSRAGLRQHQVGRGANRRGVMIRRMSSSHFSFVE